HRAGADAARQGAVGAVPLPGGARRVVPHAVLPPHGAGHRPDARGPVRPDPGVALPRPPAGAPGRLPPPDRVVAPGGGGTLAGRPRPGEARAGPAVARGLAAACALENGVRADDPLQDLLP